MAKITYHTAPQTPYGLVGRKLETAREMAEQAWQQLCDGDPHGAARSLVADVQAHIEAIQDQLVYYELADPEDEQPTGSS